MKYIYVILISISLTSCCTFPLDKRQKGNLNTNKINDSVKIRVSYNNYSKDIEEKDCDNLKKGKYLEKYGCDIFNMIKFKNSKIKLSQDGTANSIYLEIKEAKNTEKRVWRILNFVTLGVLPYWSVENYEFTLEVSGKTTTFSYDLLNVSSIFLLPAMLFYNKDYALEHMFRSVTDEINIEKSI